MATRGLGVGNTKHSLDERNQTRGMVELNHWAVMGKQMGQLGRIKSKWYKGRHHHSMGQEELGKY
ncbi:hypothetical protein KY290_005092 [Solanum tuberosum]|uniref:Uncharacterized protein n=1 Tax=Solanum tuberosum TaxID=4113 RepID=A0ABQ7WF73_SOLTU|nr:hypothetical protein KY290_005092 [Solanum tuberosum]